MSYRSRSVSEELGFAGCALSVFVRHSGICGGDAGHGGFVHIRLVAKDDFNHVEASETNTIADFIVRGDFERDLLVKGLSIILRELEQYRMLDE